MPDLFYPIAAAFLWAVSVPVVAVGIRRIPPDLTLAGVLFGLLTSLSVGTICLGLLVAPSVDAVAWSPYQALAGVFTFSIGTGLYYLCGYGFDGKMEVAAQFTKVKPLLSSLVAFVILGEALPGGTAFALPIVAVGIAVLVFSGSREGTPGTPLLLGILTAASWTAGEVFVKLGFSETTTLSDTFASLLFATLVTAGMAAPYLITHRRVLVFYRQFMLPFVCHGLISFALAYASFFHSISVNGLGRTVLIVAFWPLLSVFLSRVPGPNPPGQPLDLRLVLASVLLLIGSMIVAFS